MRLPHRAAQFNLTNNDDILKPDCLTSNLLKSGRKMSKHSCQKRFINKSLLR